MVHLEDVGPRAPRLPRQRWAALSQFTASAALHAVMLSAAAFVGIAPPAGERVRQDSLDRAALDVRHIVFLAPEDARIGGGGGGGGNQQPGPERRAQGRGADPITLRTRTPPDEAAPVTIVSRPSVEEVPPLPALALDAKPLALGTMEQIGLPSGGESHGTSTGRGSGGGVGTGTGTGLGSGRGPGVGPGFGGGIGGGVHRPGGNVSAPRLIAEVKPKYTSDALLHRIQGTVTLEAVVTRDGCTSQIRVVQSLDYGLDQQAVAAVAQWRFDPGRAGGVPVDVLVTILVDFSIR